MYNTYSINIILLFERIMKIPRINNLQKFKVFQLFKVDGILSFLITTAIYRYKVLSLS